MTDKATDIIHTHYRPRRAKHNYVPPNWLIYLIAGVTVFIFSVSLTIVGVPWLTPRIGNMWAWSLVALTSLTISGMILWGAVTITGDLDE